MVSFRDIGILRYIKPYDRFKNENLLLLPPHKEDYNFFTLNKLYNDEGKSIYRVINKIKTEIGKGSFLKIYDKKFDIWYMKENLPVRISHDPDEDEKSISFYSIHDDSTFVFDVDDPSIERFLFYLVKPKIKISDIDPLGEEDWSDENYDEMQ